MIDRDAGVWLILALFAAGLVLGILVAAYVGFPLILLAAGIWQAREYGREPSRRRYELYRRRRRARWPWL